jgi:hypothetical protein
MAMAETRRGFLTGLLLALVPVAAVQAAPAEGMLVPAQYGNPYRPPPPPRDPYRRPPRRRRCWIERRRVMRRDRYGRLHPRIIEQEVCR